MDWLQESIIDRRIERLEKLVGLHGKLLALSAACLLVSVELPETSKLPIIEALAELQRTSNDVKSLLYDLGFET